MPAVTLKSLHNYLKLIENSAELKRRLPASPSTRTLKEGLYETVNLAATATERERQKLFSPQSNVAAVNLAMEREGGRAPAPPRGVPHHEGSPQAIPGSPGVPDMRQGLDARNSGLPHRVELNLREPGQLFNTMDHSPFHERDLDHDAEEFILSWVREFPIKDPVLLVVHLSESSPGPEPQPLIEEAVHNYFAYRARLNRLEFSRLMKEGRQSLTIGLVFLLGCLAVSNLLIGQTTGTFQSLTRESLTIAGWVAMWRPMQIYLYDWWPLRRRGRVYEKLSRMPVEVRKATA